MRSIVMLLACLAMPAFAGEAGARADILLADFEGAGYGEWRAEGDAFGDEPATGAVFKQKLGGFEGKGLVNTFIEVARDRATGTLTSFEFTVNRDRLNFLIAGGRHPGKTCIDLLIDGKPVMSATGRNDDVLMPESWDIRRFRGKQARIRIVDSETGAWGHIDIDTIVLSDGRPAGMSKFNFPKFAISPAKGLGFEDGTTRRDPSDVIKVGGLFYVWYTKTHKQASGYDATVWYATSSDGKTWTEKGEAVARGPKGSWDERSTFTPSILAAEGKYYVFYTAVPNPFDIRTKTAIGVAVSDGPDGPWAKSKDNPILATGASGKWTGATGTNAADKGAWDSHRVDDACMIVRDGKYWLYFKGRGMGLTPGQTKMGVAIADSPAGPYVKHAGNPVIGSGHEVLVWPSGKGLMSLVSGSGPRGRTLQYAPDGLKFEVVGRLKGYPFAAGAYRPDAFADTKSGVGIRWGISMVHHRKWPYLVRFDCDLTADGEE